MRIAFFGSSLLSTYWNGAATYYRGLLKALARRGHRVTFYEPDAFDRQRHRDMEPPDWAQVVVYPADEAAARRCLQEARGADVVVKASGVGVLDELLQEGVPEARRPGALAILWDVDAAATLDRLRSAPEDPLRPLIPAYDLVLTYGGGRPVTEAYRAFGARRCEAVYNALDPETHHPAPPDPRFGCDLALLANRLPDREQRVEEFFLKPAALLPGRRFLLGGNGWDDKQVPGNVVRVGHVGSADHNALNCSALAVLNVARDSMARNGFSPATRVFEAAGAGACLITDAWEGLEQFLEPGREVLAAADGDEAAALLDGLSPTRARAIGEAARRRVLAEHTYDRRAAQVESLLEGAASCQARRRAIA
jgi:spore maturation protein CgeB